LLTAPGQGIPDETATPPGVPHLIATLRRLTRLLSALEDLAHYGSQAMLSQSWSRISDLLREAERLAPAGARQLAARQGDRPAISSLADHVTPITQLALIVAEHPVGSPRWWLAVHTLGQRAEESHRYLAGLTAGPWPGAQRPLWPG
jgi:hypothetical protein